MILRVNKVGSVYPSSNILSKKIIKKIDLKTSKLFVEFGGGNGCITKKILNKLRKDDVLVVFEKDKFFFNYLKKIKDDRLIIVNNDAIDCYNVLQEICKERFMEFKVSSIVSSLPLSIIENSKYIIKEAHRVLSYGGNFIQMQYSAKRYKHFKGVFNKVSTDFTIFNIPPAFVFTCYKS